MPATDAVPADALPTDLLPTTRSNDSFDRNFGAESKMRSTVGTPVVGDDFHGRERELRILSRLVRDGNHVLLRGHRRTGQTSIARELARRLGSDGWGAVFADVRNALSPEDAICELACGIHSMRPVASRIVEGMGRRFRRIARGRSTEDFRAKFRAEIDSRNWRDVGNRVMEACTKHDRPVLLVVDELPVFLSRLSREHEGALQVDLFLSWMRYVVHTVWNNCPIAFLTGSTGLAPLVARLRLSSRINHLTPFPLEPWDRDTSIQCFRRLAEQCGFEAEDDVAGAVHDSLGIGVPHFVQSMFAELRDFSNGRPGAPATASDVAEAYRVGLLGARGDGDLLRYRLRLHEALDETSFSVAMVILAEAATQGVFSASARCSLERFRGGGIPDADERITHALEVLQHDGWLVRHEDGYSFEFNLLRDWAKARFEQFHRPLC